VLSELLNIRVSPFPTHVSHQIAVFCFSTTWAVNSRQPGDNNSANVRRWALARPPKRPAQLRRPFSHPNYTAILFERHFVHQGRKPSRGKLSCTAFILHGNGHLSIHRATASHIDLLLGVFLVSMDDGIRENFHERSLDLIAASFSVTAFRKKSLYELHQLFDKRDTKAEWQSRDWCSSMKGPEKWVGDLFT
jgi:hypothetical protein